MARVCVICGKHPVAGRSIKRHGLAKAKGGVGKKITGITNVRFLPNLQSVKIILDGVRKTQKVCTNCIKSGRIVKV
mgnify:CR=1 FL=1